jgi:hypothetical protein
MLLDTRYNSTVWYQLFLYASWTLKVKVSWRHLPDTGNALYISQLVGFSFEFGSSFSQKQKLNGKGI